MSKDKIEVEGKILESLPNAMFKVEIEGGADFATVAKEHSQCPSGKDGGNLGVFGPGQMVKEFDEVVFSGEVGTVHGPVKTQFGYHLIDITTRTE